MDIDDELRLSYYKTLVPLNEKHKVFLVLNTENGRIYVKKESTVYNAQVFFYLKDHPVRNMPRIFEVVEDEGVLITVEEYISGVTLQKFIEENGLLSEERAVEITACLCKIVCALHSLDPAVIHRDIKPENIMITDDGTVKLLDLNAAKWSGTGENSKDTVLIGTAGFAAPEQYGFAPSDEKTDIYAIGVVMNFMLTGYLPGEKRAQGRLGDIIEKCTEMEPAARYNSAEEILDDLSGNTPDKKEDSWLPPGMRSKKPVPVIFSGAGYALYIWFVCTLEPSSVNKASLWLTRILLVLAGILSIFLAGNYRNIQKTLGIKKIKSRLLRGFVIILICIALFLAAVVIDVIYESVIFK